MAYNEINMEKIQRDIARGTTQETIEKARDHDITQEMIDKCKKCICHIHDTKYKEPITWGEMVDNNPDYAMYELASNVHHCTPFFRTILQYARDVLKQYYPEHGPQ